MSFFAITCRLDENETESCALHHAMERLREKDTKSIVAQRLALFKALERGRPRTDNGSPLITSCGNFIFNRGISQDIVSDFQTVNAQKSSSRQVVFEGLLRKGTGSANTFVNDQNMDNKLQNEELSNEEVPAFSVRHLRSLFESSSVALTARNSLEEDQTRGARSRDVGRCQSEAKVSPRQQDWTTRFEVGHTKSTSEEGFNKKPVPKPKDFLMEDKGHCERAMPTTSSPIEPIINGKKEDKLSKSQFYTESIVENTITSISEKPKESPPPRKALPLLPGGYKSVDDNRYTSAITEHADKAATLPTIPPKIPLHNTRHKIGTTGSVYIEPTSKAEGNKQTSPASERKSKTLPIKQRSLGRGEIKPYEIVNIVTKEENYSKAEESEQQLKEGQENPRMISMYVQTFGNPAMAEADVKLKAVEEDGYQEIPEYNEPEQDLKSKLDTDEFDLSNLELKEGITAEEVTANDQKSKMFNEYINGNNDSLESLKEDENSNHCKTASLLSFDSRGNTLSSSGLSDVFEGWDSDEFDDELTDDEVLADSKGEKVSPVIV